MPELVRQDDVDLAVREAAVEQRVPEDDARRRPHAERVGVRLARVAAHLLDPQRDAVDALRLLEALVRALQPRVLHRLEALGQIRADEDQHRRDHGEDAGSGDPPPRAEPAGERHDDEERDADRDERPAQRQPPAEDGLEVADPRDVVSAVPPQGRDRERQLRQPHDREPDHPEEHPGADRPGRRLADEPRAPLRVHPERRQSDDLRERPVDVEEALVALRLGHELAAEGRLHVHAGERQVVRDDAARQEPGRDDPACGEERVDARPRGGRAPHPTTSAGRAGSGAGSGRPRRTGEESGYRDVRRKRYP